MQQVSAGGVVFRPDSSEIVIIKTLPELRWQLPKGIIDEGESPDQAALREVREETGITAEILKPLQTIEYWYFANRKGTRVRYHKFVHFFAMKYLSGNTADHDHEVAEARWVPAEECTQLLAFESERKAVQEALDLVSTLGPSA